MPEHHLPPFLRARACSTLAPPDDRENSIRSQSFFIRKYAKTTNLLTSGEVSLTRRKSNIGKEEIELCAEVRSSVIGILFRCRRNDVLRIREEADVHRMCGVGIRAAALFFLVLIWVLAVHGQTVAATEEPREAATGFPSAAENAIGHAPYLSLGIVLIRPKNTRFFDGGGAGHAPLYGSRFTFDAGTVGGNVGFHLAPGVRVSSGFRLQLEFSLARALDWRGNTNYPKSGGHQPSEARLDTWQLLPAGFYEFPGWKLASGRRVRPFLGAGLGITGYRLSDYVQRFPEPDEPEGPLIRGPAGEIPYTALPGGSGQNPTWMLTAGVAIPIGRSIHLDLSYRYTDAGEIGTDIGDITIVRYGEDGTRREIPVTINETSAEYRINSLLVALRFEL